MSKFGKRGAPSAAECPKGIDATSCLFSPSIPSDVRAAVPLVHAASPEARRSALAAALAALEGGGGGAVPGPDAAAWPDAAAEQTVRVALWHVLGAALRHKTKLSAVSADLAAMRFPEAVAADVADVLRQRRAGLQAALVARRPALPRLEALRWRLDVAISTSALLRVMRPTVLFSATLSDGRVKTFEVPQEQFHALRFAVARSLRDMGAMSRHPIMRIVAEHDKRLLEAA